MLRWKFWGKKAKTRDFLEWPEVENTIELTKDELPPMTTEAQIGERLLHLLKSDKLSWVLTNEDHHNGYHTVTFAYHPIAIRLIITTGRSIYDIERGKPPKGQVRLAYPENIEMPEEQASAIIDWWKEEQESFRRLLVEFTLDYTMGRYPHAVKVQRPECVEIRRWIIENCEDETYVQFSPLTKDQGDHIHRVFFSDANDAMMFKLAWGGDNG
jgi:hypothetical protein